MSIGKKLSLLLLLTVLVVSADIFIIYKYISFQRIDSHIINFAGRQRMLSQRIDKLVLSVANGNDDDRRLLKESVGLYDTSLDILWHGGSFDGKIIPRAHVSMDELFRKNTSLWRQIRENIIIVLGQNRGNPLFTNAALAVNQYNDLLLKSCEDVVSAYEKSARSGKYTHEINIAGRQRMLSQKMLKCISFIAANNEVNEHRRQLRDAMELFDNSHYALKNGGKSLPMKKDLRLPPPRVRHALNISGKIWQNVKRHLIIVLNESPENKVFAEAIHNIQKRNNALLWVSNDIACLFANISRQKIYTLNKILLTLFGINLLVFAIGLIQGKNLVQPINEIYEKLTHFGVTGLLKKPGIHTNELKIISSSFDKIAEERKVREQSMHEIIKLLGAIYHEVPVGIAIISFNTLKFISVNETLCHIMEHPAGYLKEKSFVELTHSEDIIKETYLLAALQQKSRKTYKMEKRFLRKGGGIIWASVSATSLLNNAGIADTCLYLVEDITERKNTDELLLMKSRQAQIGEMISIIAHQWRQPLTIINAIASKMRNRILLNTLEEEYCIRLLSDIQKHTQHLSETIDDFRTFFNPDKLPEAVFVEDIIEKGLFLLGKSFETNNIALTLSIEYKETIKTYRNELIQVFLNLLQNIIDAVIIKQVDNPKAGIHVYEKDGFVVINVSDNAGGMPDNIMKNIFLPYFSTKGEKYGTGLGLYMCRLIIERHCKGTITAKNSAGGAVFTITLPVNL